MGSVGPFKIQDGKEIAKFVKIGEVRKHVGGPINDFLFLFEIPNIKTF